MRAWRYAPCLTLNRPPGNTSHSYPLGSLSLHLKLPCPQVSFRGEYENDQYLSLEGDSEMCDFKVSLRCLWVGKGRAFNIVKRWVAQEHLVVRISPVECPAEWKTPENWLWFQLVPVFGWHLAVEIAERLNYLLRFTREGVSPWVDVSWLLDLKWDGAVWRGAARQNNWSRCGTTLAFMSDVGLKVIEFPLRRINRSSVNWKKPRLALFLEERAIKCFKEMNNWFGFQI